MISEILAPRILRPVPQLPQLPAVAVTPSFSEAPTLDEYEWPRELPALVVVPEFKALEGLESAMAQVLEAHHYTSVHGDRDGVYFECQCGAECYPGSTGFHDARSWSSAHQSALLTPVITDWLLEYS